MSSRASAIPLAIDLKPSRRLAAYLGGVYACASAAVAALPIAHIYQGIVLTLLFGTAVVAFRTHILRRGRRAVLRLVWEVDGSWSLEQRDGTRITAGLLPGSFLHPLLTVLNFKLSRWRRLHIVLPPDAADAAQLRHLRVRLRLNRTPMNVR